MITDDMLANLPPAELIEQIEFPTPTRSPPPKRRWRPTGARWSPTPEVERGSMLDVDGSPRRRRRPSPPPAGGLRRVARAAG